MSAFKFKFDESYDADWMTIGGWVGEQSQWEQLESGWKQCIAEQNARHRPDQKIDGFHATLLNGYHDPFHNWNEMMSREFTAALVNIVLASKMMFIASAVDLRSFRRVNPEFADEAQKWCYGLAIRQGIINVSNVFQGYPSEHHVAIVFESGNWNAHAIESYDLQLRELHPVQAERFESITKKEKKDCIGLQAADLIAFETFKRIGLLEQKNNTYLRWALSQFLRKEALGESSLLGEEALITLRGN
ncbi:MAG TPA: DUF3800 domain-containing protein [Candidatus Angelobacter sp.]